MSARWLSAGAVMLGLAGTGLIAGCGGGSEPAAQASADRGHKLIVEQGCGMCHRIGGVERANGNVGPSLENFRTKRTLAGGKLPNRPEAVVRWLQNPQAVDPATVMPNLGLTPEQARQITDYLETQ